MEPKEVTAARIERKEQQKTYWTDFRDLLESIEKEYGISKTDIAKGLNVSRQSLYNFVNRPDLGIRLDRASITQFYDYIRLGGSESFKGGKKFIDKREELDVSTLNEWLAVAGYVPEETEKSNIARSTLRVNDHQVKRLVYRLTSKWIYDDALKNYLVNNFLDQILDQGTVGRKYYLDPIEYVDPEQDKRIKSPRNQDSNALVWSEKNLYDDFSQEGRKIKDKYESALRSLNQSGKKLFVGTELFELYQSILEHHYLDQELPARVSLQDCRFKSLTFDLYDRSLYRTRVKNGSRLDRQMKSCSELAERSIRGLDSPNLLAQAQLDYDYVGANPILESVIKCELVTASEERKPFSLRYSSNATHVSNILFVLQKGFCYPLDITGFFMRATGRSEKSLARVSVALADKSYSPEKSEEHRSSDKVYSGWWVTTNTLTGIQRAAVDAFMRWLSDRPFPQEGNYIEKYFDLCVGLADIREHLAISRQALYEYTPTLKSEKTQYLKEVIKTNVLEKHQKLIEDIGDAIESEYFTIHRTQLDDAVKLAKLLAVRSSLIENEMHRDDSRQQNEELLRTIIAETDESENAFSHIVRLYAIACEMTHNFIVGDEEFIVGKQWYNNPKYSLLKAAASAQSYISANGGVIDLDTYLSMSDVYGTVGYLGFYFSDSVEQLTQALEQLFKAAHFSLKIDFKKRTAQWLTYASRICIRLGELEKAEQLLSLVKGIADDVVLEEVETQLSPNSEVQKPSLRYEDLPHALESKNWVDINWLLARGESFLAEDDSRAPDAFLKCCTALKIAMELDFSRIIPDCLYDMHRAATVLAEKGKGPIDLGGIRKDDKGPFQLWSPGHFDREVNPAGKKLSEFVEKYLMSCTAIGLFEKIEDHPNRNFKSFQGFYKEIASKTLDLAIEFWNGWRSDSSTPHPVAQAIDQGKFLISFDPSKRH